MKWIAGIGLMLVLAACWDSEMLESTAIDLQATYSNNRNFTGKQVSV